MRVRRSWFGFRRGAAEEFHAGNSLHLAMDGHGRPDQRQRQDQPSPSQSHAGKLSYRRETRNPLDVPAPSGALEWLCNQPEYADCKNRKSRAHLIPARCCPITLVDFTHSQPCIPI